MAAILVGILSVALGVLGVLYWMGDFLSVLKGLLPICFIGGGLVAIFAGISAFRK